MPHGTVECHELAQKQNGLFLSEEYLGVHAIHFWKCEVADHPLFRATFNSVYRGSWCARCRRRQGALRREISLEEWERRAKQVGLTVLEIHQEARRHTTLRVECLPSREHRFWIDSNSVKNRRGCKFCAGNVRLTIEDAKALAKGRDGFCLSDTYINARTKLLWQCAQRHAPWLTSYDKIRQGTWCPECSRGLGERICRAYFEQLFGIIFPAAYPDWLRSEDGSSLELDGYAPSLQLAFEHQGKYHFSTKGYFAKTLAEVVARQRTDARKRQLCANHGVTLIEIEEIPSMQTIDTLKDTIYKKCVLAGVVLPNDFSQRVVILRQAYNPDFLHALREKCASQGGKLLELTYLGAKTRHKIDCGRGHIWAPVADSVMRGAWCRKCYVNDSRAAGRSVKRSNRNRG